jgi:hypothetical protein
MKRALPVVLVCITIGCDLPTGPGAATLVTITPGTEVLMVAATETFAAFAARSDGSGATVNATWATSNPSTATVSSQGLVTAVGPGMATITATYQNLNAVRTLRVLPSFSGSWSGRYQTTGCSGTSCAGSHAVGATGTVGVFLTQLRDQVTGFVFLDVDNVPVQGLIAVGGTLSLTGELRSESTVPGPYVNVRIDSWASTLSATRTMSGRFTHLYAETSMPFPYPLSNRVDSELVNVQPTGPP